MAKIVIEGLSVSYGEVKALEDINLEIGDGEFFVVIGPSGAGKTTLLKALAGLVEPAAGRALFDGRDMTGVPPERRDVGMTFEQYALYPNMTVRRNIEHPLRAPRAKLSEAEIAASLDRVVKTLRIDHLLERLPKELSGGQKQRVSLARALVRLPKALLLDEPLSHVDAKIRQEMRAEFSRLRRELGTTNVYVTHDYQEALALGERVAVLAGGRILQLGQGPEIYDRPATTTVARLFGQPQINLWPAVSAKWAWGWSVTVAGFPPFVVDGPNAKALEARGPGELLAGLRPQHLSVLEGDQGIPDGVELRARVYVHEPAPTFGTLVLHRPGPDGQTISLTALTPPRSSYKLDQEVRLGFSRGRLLLFDPDGRAL